jgi:hypothetical protein
MHDPEKRVSAFRTNGFVCFKINQKDRCRRS